MKATTPRYAIGIDLGTTSISATVLDLCSCEIAEVVTVPANAALPQSTGAVREQDAEAILRTAHSLLDHLIGLYDGGCTAIGLTGQMHGIVSLSETGVPLSPLATWQDGRAEVGSPSPSERIAALTGYDVPPGYGLATFYADLLDGRIPQGTAKIATIADCFGMRLTGRVSPLVHTGNAASLGLFDLASMRFDAEAVGKLGIPASVLPETTGRAALIGEYRGIPVSVAIGDNQAAFLGSVSDPTKQALANFGTGSQISLAVDPARIGEKPASRSVEIRPLTENLVLLSGSALCGGRAWAMFERFFREYLSATEPDAPAQYETMGRLAAQAFEKGAMLDVSTAFSGTRDDPGLRGGIHGIGEDNFTPGALLAGVLRGMALELFAMYETMPREGIGTLVLSGNAARMNPTLQKMTGEVFGLEIVIPACREEAALGAALWALRAAGMDTTCKGKFIRYGKAGE